MSNFSFGTPEFHSTSELHKYCENARKLMRPLVHELIVARDELYVALKQTPTGQGRARDIMAARQVTRFLGKAADGAKQVSVGMVGCYTTFDRMYLNNTPDRSRKHFDLHK